MEIQYYEGTRFVFVILFKKWGKNSKFIKNFLYLGVECQLGSQTYDGSIRRGKYHF